MLAGIEAGCTRGVPGHHSKASRSRSGGPLLVDIARLRPTQVGVGMRAVAAKRRKVEARAERRKDLARFLGKRVIPSVRGPGDGLFIIDHHHLGMALWQAEVERAYVRIVDDLSSLAPRTFWRHMEMLGWVYPYDERGERVMPGDLPRRLDGLRSDIYRDLAWSVRVAGGFVKSPEPFAEFRWAEFFRANITRRALREDYEAAVKTARRLARSKEAKVLPGYVAA
jgi:hypothetical protein